MASPYDIRNNTPAAEALRRRQQAASRLQTAGDLAARREAIRSLQGRQQSASADGGLTPTSTASGGDGPKVETISRLQQFVSRRGRRVPRGPVRGAQGLPGGLRGVRPQRREEPETGRRAGPEQPA